MGIMLLCWMGAVTGSTIILKGIMAIAERYVIPNLPEWVIQALADPKGGEEDDI